MKKTKIGEKFKIDSYRVSQYENIRIVSIVNIVETPKSKDKKILVYIESINANCLVFKNDLKIV